MPGRDAILDDLWLYWLTETGMSAARIYWKTTTLINVRGIIELPVAISGLPGDIFRAPKS